MSAPNGPPPPFPPFITIVCPKCGLSIPVLAVESDGWCSCGLDYVIDDAGVVKWAGAYQLAVSCPNCGKRNDQHAPFPDDERPPKDGDVSLCAACGSLAIFEDGQLRRPTMCELAELPSETIRAARAQASEFGR